MRLLDTTDTRVEIPPYERNDRVRERVPFALPILCLGKPVPHQGTIDDQINQPLIRRVAKPSACGGLSLLFCLMQDKK